MRQFIVVFIVLFNGVMSAQMCGFIGISKNDIDLEFSTKTGVEKSEMPDTVGGKTHCILAIYKLSNNGSTTSFCYQINEKNICTSMFVLFMKDAYSAWEEALNNTAKEIKAEWVSGRQWEDDWCYYNVAPLKTSYGKYCLMVVHKNR